ncbi:hypothetical protein K2173_020634 [Erythroxylum novogranatense]|uniref:Transmembrane protein n=1 Tax=Erythroxylum novogranatense TaxID=1862640 RepID=A0AAV8TNG8_9ROSI|nr:hypothetical protein K2173_020634 [Erythroxylum novogranatense]
MKETSEMLGSMRWGRWCLIVFLTSQIFSVTSGFSSPKNGTSVNSHSASSSNTGSKIVIIILGVVAVGLFSFFLFKLWQKKKREEQYARLLKLFEEDDELEVELGLRE